MNCNSDDSQYSLITLDQRQEELLTSKFHKEDGYYKIACVMVDSGKYDEAIKYCKLQLRAYRSLQNKDDGGQVISLLAHVHHLKAKTLISCTNNVTEISNVLKLALHYYHTYIKMSQQSNNLLEETKSFGKIGNIYHLMGKFREAVKYHQKHLRLAFHLGDLKAQRRSCTNLAHANLMIGEFRQAGAYHCKALEIALRIKDPMIEAQCFYSLGCIQLISCNYQKAIDNFQKHLQLAQSLKDRYGECRVYWSLGKAYTCVGQLEIAFVCACKHLSFAEELRDHKQVDIAQKNITDLSKVLTAKTRTSTKPIIFKKAPIERTKSMPSQGRNHVHHLIKKRLKFGKEETQTLKLS